MSMGMAFAPRTFQRLLETVFAAMIEKGFLVYRDTRLSLRPEK